MILEVVTITVTCPHCTQRFTKKIWFPIHRALEDPACMQADEWVMATCPACGCTSCISVQAGTVKKKTGTGDYPVTLHERSGLPADSEDLS